MSLTDIQRKSAEKTQMKGKSHLLAALGGHLSEQRGEKSRVLEQDAPHDSQVGGHHHGISL